MSLVKANCDFSGYATKNNLLCGDGRIIRKDAFRHCDGRVVPLVWNHGGRKDPNEIIGHALLENKDDGVYTYGFFNDSDFAKVVEKRVKHGDITGLSIYANSLKQNGSDVLHGDIKEVSLVLVGANPGATIDFVMQHSEDADAGLYYYLNGNTFSEIKVNRSDMSHSYDDYEYEEDYEEDEDESAIYHADDDEDEKKGDEMAETNKDNVIKETEVEKVLKSLNDKQKEAVMTLIGGALVGEGLVDVDDDDDGEEDEATSAELDKMQKETMRALDSLSDEQKAAVTALIDTVVEDAKSNSKLNHSDDYEDEDDYEEDDDYDYDYDDDYDDEDEDEDYDDDEDYEEGDDMKHNEFEHSDNAYNTRDSYIGVMQTALSEIIRNKSGKLSDAILRHAEEYGLDEDSLQHAYPTNEFNQEVTYGISNIHYLFPDAKAIGDPAFVQRNQEWVSKFLSSTRHSPFSRVKSLYFDITADEARAKGYVKGTKKSDEVIVLLKRKTEPTTIYKKQKLDRDDKLDIANAFDVVKMMRNELSVMVDEELARCSMIGDGRGVAAPDKISELNIRPIYTDDDVYSIKVTVQVPSDATEDEVAKAVIKGIIKKRKEYKGSGRPMFFMNPDYLADMLLLEDGIGRSLYPTENELSTKLRVSELVEVPIFENVTRTSGGKTLNLVGIILNPIDYCHGTDRGGEKTMMDGFDIDYNQEKYLLETRCSGALVQPYSAMVVEVDPSGDPIHG